MPNFEAEAPGVFVLEETSTPAIAGVSTSVTAFIGVSTGAKMPKKNDANQTPYTLVPEATWELVTNYGDFTRKFGELDPGNKILALSVSGYFANGGKILFVARVSDIDDKAKVEAALQKLEANTEVSIVAAPGALDSDVQDALITHAVNLKDRFVILDGQNVTTFSKDGILGSLGTKTDYAALYFPHVIVSVPVTIDPTERLALPPSGLMAGIYARVDSARGVHKAPANEQIRGAVGLSYLTSEAEQALVNSKGINIIRSFNGTIKVWGARTLNEGGGNFIKYIPVRRLMIFLSKSIDISTQWVVFEPNSDPLWQKITRSVDGFLTRVWRDGALFGVKKEQAFFVTCNESTNPAEDREAGIVTTLIGVAPVRPAEFVVFRISQAAELPTV